MRTFTFNGVSSKDHFLTNDIRREYLPPITVPSIKVPNRAGEVALKRNEIGVRTIEIDITLMGYSDTDLRSRTRALTSFLLYTEDKELIFSDEPNLKYFARFNQTSTSLEEIASTGAGTIIFTCFDPYAYNVVEHTQLTNNKKANLLPSTVQYLDLTKWTNWYNNLELKGYTFPSGATGLMGTMIDVATNPRFRIVSSPDNGAPLIKGQVYTVTVEFQHSSKLEKIEMAGINYYKTNNGETPLGWETFPYVTVDSLPINDEVDNTKLYKHTFTAQQTAEARLSFGFGLGNALIDNGTWLRIKLAKIEAGSESTPDIIEPTTFMNNGTAKVYPILRVATAQDSNYITIRNLTNNKSITVNHTVPAWDVLLIDTNKNTVAIQDPATNTEINGLPFTSLNSEFFPLEVGANEIVVENEDTTGLELAGKLRVYWRERYL